MEILDRFRISTSSRMANIRLPFTSRADDIEWARKVSTLEELMGKCQMYIMRGPFEAEIEYGNPHLWFRNAVTEYNERANNDCNFQVIENDDNLCDLLIKTLPTIIYHALNFPDRLVNPLHALRNGENEVLYLKRNLVCSIIANGFLSTFPNQNSNTRTYFNFWRLFHEHYQRENQKSRSDVKREKIKCLLEYFRHMGSGDIPDTVISYKRFHSSQKVDWEKVSEKLSNLSIISNSGIEDAEGMLQVDFANTEVGGGVLHDGAVQEEIRFCINPELLASRVFTDRLGCEDVLVVTGTRQFSSYTGYGQTFRFEKFDGARDVLPVDSKGREYTQIVAMDAMHFYESTEGEQYEKRYIDRELHKSYIAFIPGKHVTPVATGNWGCGAFMGDPQLKFLIQWMSASKNRRPILFHARDDAQHAELENMATFLESKEVKVGELYKVLVSYGEIGLIRIFGKMRRRFTLFEYIREALG